MKLLINKLGKEFVLKLFEKIINSDNGRRLLLESFSSDFIRSPHNLFRDNYDHFPIRSSEVNHNHSRPPIIITGRFRSGTTLLWNIFRQIDGHTAYYEPLNERRWFDSAMRGNNVDSSHLNVDKDYWREYDGFNGELKNLYHERWINRHLYMDESCSDWDLQRYLLKLDSLTLNRSVFQFNRIDFRLSWLKSIFPSAYFIHIYRSPRDQWISTLMQMNSFGSLSGTLHDFVPYDKFYLTSWVYDLQYTFPFLKDFDRHPYSHFYFLWKLSYMFGRKYCDASIGFEDLVENPKDVLSSIFSDIGIETPPWTDVLSLIETPQFGKWAYYASDAWFCDIESACDNELSIFFRQNVK